MVLPTSACTCLLRLTGMLRELLTDYGPVSRLYFDFYGYGNTARRPSWAPPGLFPAAWLEISKLVRALSPHTAMLPGAFTPVCRVPQHMMWLRQLTRYQDSLVG